MRNPAIDDKGYITGGYIDNTNQKYADEQALFSDNTSMRIIPYRMDSAGKRAGLNPQCEGYQSHAYRTGEIKILRLK